MKILRLSALLPSLLLASPQGLAGQESSPQLQSGLRLNSAAAYPGYTLFSPLRTTDVLLVDMHGKEVHRWRTELPPGGGVYLLPNGHLLRSAREPDNPRFRGGGIGGRIQQFDWDGALIWDYLLADDYQTQHHDLEPLPNGNVLAIVWEHRYPEDAKAFGRSPEAIAEAGLWTTAVLELKPLLPDGAELVWEWHLWDHLIQDFDVSSANYGGVAEHAERLDINYDNRDARPMGEAERQRLEQETEQMKALGYLGDDDDDDDDDASSSVAARAANKSSDWMHMNAIDYNAALDLIVLSSPEASELYVIDHQLSSEQAAGNRGGRWKRGGDLLYRWGNPANYGAGERADRRLYYQHDPSWLETEAGPALLVFNNGGGREARGYSSVDELPLPFDLKRGFLRAKDQAFGPAKPSWSYSDGEAFYSGFISGSQRLPNGNTLICAGAQGRIFEVTPEGELVWDYINPFEGNASIGQGGNAPAVALFRATRIGLEHPGLKGHEF